MKGNPDQPPLDVGPSPSTPVLDLNELLLDHPCASFVFRCPLTDDIMIVDRVAQPEHGAMVIVKDGKGFLIETFEGQDTWGVVMYQIHKLALLALFLSTAC